jgi:hypothetical protein
MSLEEFLAATPPPGEEEPAPLTVEQLTQVMRELWAAVGARPLPRPERTEDDDE